MLSLDPTLTSTAVIALSGGAAGSVLTLIVSHLLEQRREHMLRTRAKSLVKHELQIVRDYVNNLLESPNGDIVPLGDNAPQVALGRSIRASLQFLTMSTELKLRSFDTKMLNELQSVYLEITSIESHKTVSIHTDFAYTKDYLRYLVKIIDNLLNKLS